MWRKKVTLGMTILAVCGMVVAQGAEYTILEKTERIETSLYGTPQTGALQDRLQELANTLRLNQASTDNLQEMTDGLYKDVYGNDGEKLSVLTTLNLLQSVYAHKVTDEPVVVRLENVEESIFGHTQEGSIQKRLSVLRQVMLGNHKYTPQLVVIPAGMLIPLQTLDAIDSVSAQEGDIIRLAATKDIRVGDAIVIPEGTTTDAIVGTVRKARRFGIDGKLELKYQYIRGIDGTAIALKCADVNSQEYQHMANAAGASAAGALILGPVGLVGGLFVHGKEAVLPKGTTVYVQTVNTTEVSGVKQLSTNVMQLADKVAESVPVTKLVGATAPRVPVPVSLTSMVDSKENHVEEKAVSGVDVGSTKFSAMNGHAQKMLVNKNDLKIIPSNQAVDNKLVDESQRLKKKVETKAVKGKASELKQKEGVQSGNDDEIIVTIKPTRKGGKNEK